jgi:quercetin dioxygenase-like cupin family protein
VPRRSSLVRAGGIDALRILLLPPYGSVMIPTTAFATTVDDIAWEQTDADGTRSATLVGTRQPGETFTYAFFIPAGVWDQPHSHIADAHLVVARGELRLGYGEDFDRDTAARYPAGSFLHVPAGAVHFDGAEQDTVLLGTAVGPWSTDYVRSQG